MFAFNWKTEHHSSVSVHSDNEPLTGSFRVACGFVLEKSIHQSFLDTRNFQVGAPTQNRLHGSWVKVLDAAAARRLDTPRHKGGSVL